MLPAMLRRRPPLVYGGEYPAWRILRCLPGDRWRCAGFAFAEGREGALAQVRALFPEYLDVPLVALPAR